MIIHQGQLSNLEVSLDLRTGATRAHYGRTLVGASVVPLDTDPRTMVRAARQWIVQNGWWN